MIPVPAETLRLIVLTAEIEPVGTVHIALVLVHTRLLPLRLHVLAKKCTVVPWVEGGP